ncbi:MAG TPA: hypothetical protein VGK30_06010 [Candidatus Binatia bacterium]|jgi:uncharacterized protein (DUF2267 family)
MNTPRFFRYVAGCLDRDLHHAQALTGVVFQELHDRLPPGASSAIATRLPPGLKRLWMANPQAIAERAQPYSLELLGEVMQRCRLRDSGEAEHAVVAVLAAFQHFFGEATEPEGVASLVRELAPDLAIAWRAATLLAAGNPDVRPARRDPRPARDRRGVRRLAVANPPRAVG